MPVTNMQPIPMIKKGDNVFDDEYGKIYSPLIDKLGKRPLDARVTRAVQADINTLNRRSDVRLALVTSARNAYATVHGVAQLMLNVFTNRTLEIQGGEITFGMRATAGYVAELEGDTSENGYLDYYCSEQHLDDDDQIVESMLAGIGACAVHYAAFR
jgi:hypothetical protein